MSVVLDQFPDWAWFCGAVIFAVFGLETFRLWGERRRGDGRAAIFIVSGLFAIAFGAMIFAGVHEYLTIHVKTFRALGFFLTGAAGMGILGDITVRNMLRRRPADAEMRRVLARDL